jgi:hypothetical protein
MQFFNGEHPDYHKPTMTSGNSIFRRLRTCRSCRSVRYGLPLTMPQIGMGRHRAGNAVVGETAAVSRACLGVTLAWTRPTRRLAPCHK